MNSFRKELIKRALWSAELKEISFLDSFSESKVPHSAEYNEKISSLINEEKKIFKPKRKLLVAIIAAILVCALSVTAIAFSEPIRKLIIEICDTFTRFTSNDGQDDVIKEDYQPFYLPLGYEKETYNKAGGVAVITYKNGDKEIEFSQVVMSVESNYDTENFPMETIKIGDIDAFFFGKWSNDMIVWTDTKYRYTLTYPEELDFSEVEKIINSVSPTTQSPPK